jgi:NAD(P)-dependent dehydrogenase (short-subunit alcohol dehydrogenase family)
MSKTFESKTVLVTGGNSGIGQATARLFVEQGARVIITGRDQHTIDETVRTLGPTGTGLVSDASSLRDIDALVAHLTAMGTVLDAVFVNAGVARFAPINQADQTMFDESFAINVKGPYFLMQRLAPLLNKDASIVLNGSVNAHMGMPGSSVYAATKAALISLAKTFSAELLPQGVRVNVVSPGPIETPIYGRLGMSPEQLQATAQGLMQQIPLGRFGTANEIAEIVLFLASPASSFLVGTEVIADGGMTTL